MKFARKCLVLVLAAALSAGLAACGSGGDGGSASSDGKQSLTVFNYSEYLDPDVIDAFTEETGIEIKYEEALTPEDLYTKYKSGAIQYDLVCSSDYMMKRLIEEGELQKIDLSAFENKDNIGEKYWQMSEAFDPGNQYTVPHFWGTVGILYNTTMVKEPIDSWEVLFNHEYAGNIIMQNSVRDSYIVALKYLGYSLNTTDENEIREAHELLMAQKPDVQAYLVDEARDEVVAGNAAMAVVYSGEAYLGNQYNSDLTYVVPKEGSEIWIDSWGVTKDCQNLEAAQKFLDFLCREENAQKNFEYIYYSTPNQAVIDAMSPEDRANEALVPPESSMENCEVCTQTDAATTALYNDLWKELKAE